MHTGSVLKRVLPARSAGGPPTLPAEALVQVLEVCSALTTYLTTLYADTPARAKLLNMFAHSGNLGCQLCAFPSNDGWVGYDVPVKVGQASLPSLSLNGTMLGAEDTFPPPPPLSLPSSSSFRPTLPACVTRTYSSSRVTRSLASMRGWREAVGWSEESSRQRTAAQMGALFWSNTSPISRQALNAILSLPTCSWM